MARPLDTSGARCDTCGKPYKPGDALYSIASRFNEDRTVLLGFRHAGCDTPIEKLFDEIRGTLADLGIK